MYTPGATPRAGLSKQQAGGALTKLKLDNAGIVSVLYEQVRPRRGTAGRVLGCRPECSGDDRKKQLPRCTAGHPPAHVSRQSGIPCLLSCCFSTAILAVQDLKARTKLAVSGQFNALDLNQAPKFGFGCECCAACVMLLLLLMMNCCCASWPGLLATCFLPGCLACLCAFVCCRWLAAAVAALCRPGCSMAGQSLEHCPPPPLINYRPLLSVLQMRSLTRRRLQPCT